MSRCIRWFFGFFLVCSAMAGEDLHLFKLDVQSHGETMTVTGQAVPILPDALFADQFLELSTTWPQMHFDVHYRYGLEYINELDQRREDMIAFITTSTSPPRAFVPLIYFPMKLYVYDLKGKLLQREDIGAGLGLTSIPGEAYILLDRDKIPFKIKEVRDNPELYRDWLNKMLFFKPLDLNNENEDVMIQIIGEWPVIYKSGAARLGKTLAPHPEIFREDWQQGLRPQMALSLARRTGEGWRIDDFDALARFANVLTAFRDDRNQSEAAREKAVLDYRNLLPVGPPGLRAQIMQMTNQGLEKRALDLYHDFEPYLKGGFHQDLPVLLQTQIDQRLAKLNAERDQHPRAEGVTLRFHDLVDDDVVGGAMKPGLSIEGDHALLLRLDLFLDEQPLANFTQAPFHVESDQTWPLGIHRLRALAWFEDDTWAETEIRLKGIEITMEDRAHLLPIRAVVTKGRGFITNLEQEDFKLVENGQEKPMAHFRRETTPLRIALLMDNSLTMQGMKHRRAAYAMWSFAKNLEEGDKVALYAFNDDVVRLTDFSHDAEGLLKPSYTLHPRGATSLYDAIWAAHHDLMQQEDGNRVMVILSDGVDSVSRANRRQVEALFQDSPVMVYSVFIPPKNGGFRDDPNLHEGRLFLDGLARKTGSVSLQVKGVRTLEEKLAEIYTELKSFYYLDYYTTYTKAELRNLELEADRGVVRFRHFPIEEQ